MTSGAQQPPELAAAINTLAGALTAIADAIKYHAELYRETQKGMQASMVALLERSRADDDQEDDS